MCSAVSVFRAGAPLQSPPRWFYTKMGTPPCSLHLSRSTSSLSQGFFPVSRLCAPCRVKSSQLPEAASTLRNKGYSFRRLLPSPLHTRAAERARSPSTTARATASPGLTSSAVCHAGPLSASLALAFPLLSAVPASRRFFASSSPGSEHPPSTLPASSQQLPAQPGQEQGSHEVEKRHGDEVKNFYRMPSEHHGDPRHHINPDGTLKFQTTAESFHWENDAAATPAQQIVSINGKKMIKGVETRDFVELFQIHQKNIPFWPRMRLSTWGNHDLLMKAEFLFFWVPTFIIWSLAVPMFTMLYMTDEAVYASMTVKVIGRQWYWIYEVESPVDNED